MTLPKEASALVHTPGDNSLHLETLHIPSPAQGDDHLIRVRAVAITNGELAWPEPASQQIPIPGYEVAGTVVVAPPESPYAPGAEVYARTAFDRQGSARIFTIARTAELALKPRNLSWEEAATVPLSALTAWQALFVHGGLTPPGVSGAGEANAGKRLLVTAAAGGVGIWAVQLARSSGIHVVGTSGASNLEFVRQLGADDVLDYKNLDLALWAAARPDQRFDLVLDCVGGPTLKAAWACAAPGGLVISVALPAHLQRPATGVADGVRSLWFIVDADSSQLNKITRLIEDGSALAFYDSAFDLEDYGQAFDRVRGGHLRGKVVLRL